METLVPLEYREIEAKISGVFWRRLRERITGDERRELDACIRISQPSAPAIKAAKMMNEEVPGTEVKRGNHLRVD